jgi:dTDP-4-amino-4,6-dideoxygalactose transaminase
VIVQADPKAQYLSHQAEIDAAIRRVLGAGHYILGEETRSFEEEFARYIGCPFGVGVGTGTDALTLALRAHGVGPGNEVISVSHTAVATAAAIEACGATPVFVDIEPEYQTMDPACLRAAITSRTRAVVPVHLYGQMADMNSICSIAREAGLAVIEDCAQSHGAELQGKRAGSFGDSGCFSFYPTKNLGAIGDGGMVVTRSPEVADHLKLLREYGWTDRYVSHVPGFNSRLDELQAAILRVKLTYLDADNEKRIGLADRYDRGLAGLPLSVPARRTGGRHVFHLYVIRTRLRDDLRAFLRRHGVGTGIHYPVPVHLQPAYQGRVASSALQHTERAAQEILSLPLYPELSTEAVDTVCRLTREFFSRTTA